MHKITHIIGMDLLNQVRQKLRAGHYAYRTEQADAHWIERFIRWHAKIHKRWRHPSEMGTSEVEAFLSHLAGDRTWWAEGRSLWRSRSNKPPESKESRGWWN